MNTRLFQVLSVAILATFSVTSFSQSAVPFAIDPSALTFETPTAPVSQKAKIAILLPEIGSPYEAINASLVQGIEAENKQNGSPYEILPYRENGDKVRSLISKMLRLWGPLLQLVL